MTLEQIKRLTDKNITVNWKNSNYIVKKELNNYNVVSLSNDNIVGLTYKSNDKKCTHNLEDFYVPLPF
jgi:hypothetical protein